MIVIKKSSKSNMASIIKYLNAFKSQVWSYPEKYTTGSSPEDLKGSEDGFDLMEYISSVALNGIENIFHIEDEDIPTTLEAHKEYLFPYWKEYFDKVDKQNIPAVGDGDGGIFTCDSSNENLINALMHNNNRIKDLLEGDKPTLSDEGKEEIQDYLAKINDVTSPKNIRNIKIEAVKNRGKQLKSTLPSKKNSEILSSHVNLAGFKNIVLNRLYEIGIESIRDLVILDVKELLKHRGFGLACMSDIKYVLKKLSLKVGMTEEEIRKYEK